MANINAPMGFQPYRHRGGGIMRPSKYLINSTYATSLYTGDAVILSSGFLAIGAQDSAVIAGVFAGCEFLDASGVPGARFSPYWPGGTVTTGSADAIAWVYDDPMISYLAQCYSVTAFVAATHRGFKCDLIANTAGSTLTGQSGMEVNLGDTGTGQLLVLDAVDQIGNAVGVNTKVECMFIKSLLAGT